MFRTAGRLAPLVALLALLVAPAWPGATGGQVAAHAQLVASSPAAGDVVQQPLDELRLVFSERLEAQVTSLDITAADGTELVSRGGAIDSDDRYALVLSDVELADGVYTVTWRTLSADDGHTAEGFFSFAVGDAGAGIPASGSHAADHVGPDPLRVVGRWATYIGLLFALGVPVFHAVVIRSGPMPRALRRALAGGLLISAVATLVVTGAAALEARAFPGYLVETRSGLLHLGRAGVAAAGVVALVVAAPRAAGALAMAAGIAGIVLLVAAGHAAALPGPASTVVHAVHVAGAAVWVSGIAALLALAIRPSILTGGDRPVLRALVPRFSALALVSVGIVGLTGIYAAWTQTGTLLPADTEYGRSLLLKTLVAGGALAIGGLNFLDGATFLRRLPSMRSRLVVETTAIAAVLLVTAVLATTPPTEEVGGIIIEPIPDAFGATAQGIEMEVAPGRPGVNRVTVTTDGHATTSALVLSLDRLDTGTTTRIDLVPEGGGHDMGEVGGHDMGSDAGGPGQQWTADAVVLPPESSWDTTVRLLDNDDRELQRQRFAFAFSDDGIASGARETLVDPGLAAGAVLLLGGALGAGAGLGGVRLPRTEAVASRAALIGGGVVAAAVGAVIGLQRMLG